MVPTAGDGPFPLVVCFHGGGWSAGHRNDLRSLLPQLAQRGYVAATVSYRLAPKHPLPAQIHDAKAAVKFLREHAADYRIDGDRVGAIGFSAGGPLAMMLGMTGPDDGLEGYSADAEQSGRVQAVVNYFGKGDFRGMKRRELSPEARKVVRDYYKTDSDSLLKGVFGTLDSNAPIFARVSPIVYADAGDAPILTFQGTKDEFVPYEDNVKFDKAMKEAGASHELVVLENEGHGFTSTNMAITMARALQFFDKHLKKPPADTP